MILTNLYNYAMTFSNYQIPQTDSNVLFSKKKIMSTVFKESFPDGHYYFNVTTKLLGLFHLNFPPGGGTPMHFKGTTNIICFFTPHQKFSNFFLGEKKDKHKRYE